MSEKIEWLVRLAFLGVGALVVAVQLVLANRVGHKLPLVSSPDGTAPVRIGKRGRGYPERMVARVGTYLARSLTSAQELGFLALVVWGMINVAFVVFLCFNHFSFPLNLDLMEGTILQHVQRAAAFQPIYPEPMPEYVPLAYNPLYYVLCVPLVWLMGADLQALRLASIIGMAGAGLVLWVVVRQKTFSQRWALLTLGIYAAAYSAMDAYLDTAHSDSWLLFSALLGTYLLSLNRSRGWTTAGVAILVASFWFKQHGALFVLGGLLFLTWRDGLRPTLLYWFLAAILGPLFYFILGPVVFGPRFLYFTWEVPRQWSELGLATFRRYLAFIATRYLILALCATVHTLWIILKDHQRIDIWRIQFVFAALSGLMGTLDPGSSNNVYIPMGAWFILMGVLGLHALSSVTLGRQRPSWHILGLFAVFSALLYNPLKVVVPSDARESYREFVHTLQELDGRVVYAPSLGQLPTGYTLYPAAHWVALEDMVRGPGRETRDQPLTRRLLAPCIEPAGPAYIVANHPLTVLNPAVEFLSAYYALDTDWGDRFRSLKTTASKYGHGWPRYLYRYTPGKAGG